MPKSSYNNASDFCVSDALSGTDKKNGKTTDRFYTIVHEQEQTAETAVLSGANPFRYIGTALGVFLIAEQGDTLYLIDQHAAHERILYDRIMAAQGRRQELLVPYVVETLSEADDLYLEGIKQELDNAGFSAENCGGGRWEFHSLPERWQGTENDLARGLLDKRLEPGEIISSLAALSACKAAVKDGYVLDEGTAADLAKKALDLPDPHCPHGRPVFTAITRRELFALVKRT
jgi:DNA mismatch repair protein MutL